MTHAFNLNRWRYTMKTKIASALAATGLLFSTSLFSFEANEYEVSELNYKTFNEVFAQEQEHVIFKFKEGASFPLKVMTSGEIFEFESGDNLGHFIVKSPFYIYVHYPKDLTEDDFNQKNPSKILEKCEFLFSKDKENWKPFEDFIGGNISTSIFSETEQDACVEVKMNLEFKS